MHVFQCNKACISVSFYFRLIFAGKELPNDLVVGQCDLGQNSILHAVRIVTATSGDVGTASSSSNISTTQTTSPANIKTDSLRHPNGNDTNKSGLDKLSASIHVLEMTKEFSEKESVVHHGNVDVSSYNSTCPETEFYYG